MYLSNKYNVSFRFTNVLWARAWWNFEVKKAILTKPLVLVRTGCDVLQPRRCLNCLPSGKTSL